MHYKVTGRGKAVVCIERFGDLPRLNVSGEIGHAARRLRDWLMAQAHAAQDDGALDLLAEELRLAHNALGTITGAFSADDLLGEIFTRFCIGK